MAELQPSVKRLMISKANSRIVGVTAGASFIVMFCLVASYTLLGQLNYQNRVIGKKKEALSQLEQNIENTKSLVGSYQNFVNTPNNDNVIGGINDGITAQDGDNAKIVLDALPSKYDFPALVTSLEKIAKNHGVRIENITGTDDEVAQANSATAAPQPIPMPFEITLGGKYPDIKKVVDAFDRSIRPIQIQTIQIAGSEEDMTLTITAQTYYQPEKTLNIRSEVVQ